MSETCVVLIKGKAYDWTAGEGLDPACVTELDGWIARLARRYLPKAAVLNLDLSDLIQAGYIGALTAAKTFNPASATFLTWATFRIKDEMLRLCRPDVNVSLEDVEIAIADNTGVEAANNFTLRRVEKILAPLSKREKDLVKLRFGIGTRTHTVTELGRMYGCTAQAVLNRITAALSKARKHAKKEQLRAALTRKTA